MTGGMAGFKWLGVCASCLDWKCVIYVNTWRIACEPRPCAALRTACAPLAPRHAAYNQKARLLREPWPTIAPYVYSEVCAMASLSVGMLN